MGEKEALTRTLSCGIERVVLPSRVRRGRMATAPVWRAHLSDGQVWQFITRREARTFANACGWYRLLDDAHTCTLEGCTNTAYVEKLSGGSGGNVLARVYYCERHAFEGFYGQRVRREPSFVGGTV